MPQRPDDKTAADLLAGVGRAIFPGDDWQARLARALGVERDTIRQWQHVGSPQRGPAWSARGSAIDCLGLIPSDDAPAVRLLVTIAEFVAALLLPAPP